MELTDKPWMRIEPVISQNRLADEPTGNLDSAHSEEISHVLHELNRKEGLTIILVTHNPALAKTADRIIELKDGALLPA
jgi:putative ABC transport system ATP-binding protein